MSSTRLIVVPVTALAVLSGATAQASAPAAADPLKGHTFVYSKTDGQYHVYNARRRHVAELTAGTRTALVHGTKRTFREKTTTATVATDAWVRKLRVPFTAAQIRRPAFRKELAGLIASKSPDMLAIAMQYVVNAPAKKDAKGVRYAGDAHYGPMVDGKRQEGSDFNDYLGVSWRYFDNSVDKPEKAQYGSLDCSGFVRMVAGYRMGWPLENKQYTRTRLPRRAVELERYAPGRAVIPNKGKKPASLAPLQAGDLLFWDADKGDGKAVDHVGIFIGKDSKGFYRFISSRKTADGPTMGDVGGRSVLNRKGSLYSDSFRSAKRI
ncbi:NlpC/P60 family protein [Spirillospora sp. NPDC048911]|uniref:NlpC/P60 family protein n=1 Tax=Spirillospora sp. NPDC048911 TaxID=3364527 RepID=UPI00371D84E8